MAESDIEGLKTEIDRSKKDSRAAEERYADALHHWQSKVCETKLLMELKRGNYQRKL